MAHEIEIRNGIASAAFARKAAWHGLGKVFDRPMPMQPLEAIQAAGLDWKVEKRQLFRLDNKGNQVPYDGRFATVRVDTDEELGVVGSDYVPLQNEDQIGFLQGVVGEGCKIEALASLHGGKKVFALCRMTDCFEVVPDDVVEPYLLTSNTHDGTGRWISMLTSIRVVCQNTLSAALGSNGRQLALRHDGSLERSIESARQALGFARSKAERMADEAKALAKKTMRTKQLTAFLVEQVESLKFGKEQSEMVLADLAQRLESPTNSIKGMRGTAWQAYNTWSEWVDHAPRGTGRDKRVDSILMGVGNTQKNDAWRTLLATC
jgi:phage/plasmid-like protein (TIGR03299 family)